MATRSTVADRVATNFSVTREQALKLIAYHNEICANLNEAHAVMTVAPRVELNKTTTAEIGSPIAQGILSFIPFFGGLASTAASIAIEKGDRAYQMQGYENFCELSPRKDQSEWCSSSREIADLLTISMVNQIKDLDEKKAKELGQEHAIKIINGITNGELKGATIDEEESLKKMINIAEPQQFSEESYNAAKNFKERLLSKKPSSTLQPISHQQVFGLEPNQISLV